MSLPAKLSKSELHAVLGLTEHATPAEVRSAGDRLLAILEVRRNMSASRRVAGEENMGSEEGRTEIPLLRASLDRWAPGPPSAEGQNASHPPTGIPSSAAERAWTLREQVLAATAATLACFILLQSWFGLPGSRTRSGIAAEKPAVLFVESRPQDADLRIVDAENQELLLKVPSQSLRVELAAGRYAIEVSRADCPDVWMRDVELEAGEARRFEALVCAGAGELVVRSNVPGDRLRVDDLDLGSTRQDAHLLGTGDHRVRVHKEGFQPFDGTVRIRPGERIELQADLVPGSGAEGIAGSAQTAKNDTRVVASPLPFQVVPPTEAPSISADKASSRQGPSASRLEAAQASSAAAQARSRASTRAAARADLPRVPFGKEKIRPEPFKLEKPDLGFLSADLETRFAEGGSTPWLDRMTLRILGRYDADRSGAIDRDGETDSLPCSLWSEIEGSFDEARLGLSMARFYGFDGTEWHPRALGFAEPQREVAYARMQACGLAS